MPEPATPDLADIPRDRAMAGRRFLFIALVVATIATMLWIATIALSPAGLSTIDLIIIALFGMTLPWPVIGFWNALIGLLILRLAKDPLAIVFATARQIRDDVPVTASTAILLCVRNEAPWRLIRNAERMLEDLAAHGAAHCFHLYILSDTDDPELALAEARQFQMLAARWRNRIAVTYRRRPNNSGYKAGNIRDFCDRWGHRHAFAITLDADSFMPAEAILRLVRIMQADPKLGILQGLVIGLPSTSAFTRLFQFGMRLAMRSYTIGSAWWQGDCGPYWGHNAVLRLGPFIAHCGLPALPPDRLFGGPILSHDQLEAALMRRAGYAVRVLPQEDLGWEENPPTLTEFIRRDLRWCQGNMQYWHFLSLPGLHWVSRFQLAFAILMFLGSPAWIGLIIFGTLALVWADTPAAVIRSDAGVILFALMFVMWFSPRLATAIDILLRPRLRDGFGGTLRFAANVAAEIAFSILLTPIMWCAHTIFLAAGSLRRTTGWRGQLRDHHMLSWPLALRALWPHTAFGLAIIVALAIVHPAALAYALFVTGGPLLSIPFAVVTAWPRLGKALTRLGIGRLPEETDPPQALSTLGLSAIKLVREVRPRRACGLGDHA